MDPHDEKKVMDFVEWMKSLPSDDDRYAVIHLIGEDVCLLCGKVTATHRCYCAPQFDE